MPNTRIKRGQFIRLPDGAGSIAIERGGKVLYRPAAKKKAKASTAKRKPTRRQKNPISTLSWWAGLPAAIPAMLTRPKKKKPAKRVGKALKKAVKKANARKTNGAARRKGARR